MRWPPVEFGGGWDLASIYYERPYRKEEGDRRIDIFDDAFTYSDVLLDVSRLAAHRSEVLWATALHVSWQTAFDIRISTTTDTIRVSAECVGAPVDESFIRELAEAAERGLCGFALVSALRSCAWAAFLNGELKLRTDLATKASQLLDALDVEHGRSAILADDAHAHLNLASRIDVSRSSDPDHASALASYREELADTGLCLLAAALAHASRDRWNPFTRHRLMHEIEEHAPQFELIANSARVEQLRGLLGTLKAALLNLDVDLQARYMEHLEQRPNDDIASYFYVRSNHRTLGPPLPIVHALLREERTWRRLI